jgi:thiol-disulfide isomerase/thioredoxin
VAAVLVLSACGSNQDFRFVTTSGPAPGISGRTLTGELVSPQNYAGKTLIVNFWNPFCAPCRREQPLLQSEWERLGDGDVRIIGLMFVGGSPAWPNDPDAARTYLRKYGVTYPVLTDEKSRLADGFRIPGIPTTVVVDRRGQMRFRVLGAVKPGELDELIAKVED